VRQRRQDGHSAEKAVSEPPTAPTAPTTVAERGWKRVFPGGGCQRSDGSRFNFWVRQADPMKVVLFLESGSGCFSARTCARDSGLYVPAVSSEENPACVRRAP
jgi:hypothetical protein